LWLFIVSTWRRLSCLPESTLRTQIVILILLESMDCRSWWWELCLYASNADHSWFRWQIDLWLQ
jgi:hypothetical protein